MPACWERASDLALRAPCNIFVTLSAVFSFPPSACGFKSDHLFTYFSYFLSRGRVGDSRRKVWVNYFFDCPHSAWQMSGY